MEALQGPWQLAEMVELLGREWMTSYRQALKIISTVRAFTG